MSPATTRQASSEMVTRVTRFTRSMGRNNPKGDVKKKTKVGKKVEKGGTKVGGGKFSEKAKKEGKNEVVGREGVEVVVGGEKKITAWRTKLVQWL